jgi:hypothetical protein
MTKVEGSNAFSDTRALTNGTADHLRRLGFSG